jgi:general secretion pathway protein N
MNGLRPFLRLAVAAALGVAVAGTAWAQPQRRQEPVAPVQAEVPELPPLATLSATRERPLFVRSRRPPAAPPKVAQKEADPEVVASEEAPAELIGIVIGPERTYAILKDRATKEVQHLQKGEKIDDWSLDEIEARHIVLSHGATKIHVELFDQKEADASKGQNADEDDDIRRRRPQAVRQNRPRYTQPQRRRPAPPRRVPQRSP